MRGVLAWVVVAGLLAPAVGCSPDGDGGPRDAGRDTGVVDVDPDEDGDNISDLWEGRPESVDTDGDGTPDYLDSDSDADGIPDEIEGGQLASGPEPVDSDGDGTPDYRDLDSDGNGLDDLTEGFGDTDGDRVHDAADFDNDADSVRDEEEIGDPAAPTDFDGDAIPDHLDRDSDNDTISDLHEGVADTDADMVPDRHDLDSDGDGWSDLDEAGDAVLETAPADSDADLIYDFRDPDSDNDGISDAAELGSGTRRDLADTDGDGVSDLVEIAGCPPGDASCVADAIDPTSSPRTRGDFVFFEPYMMPPDPPRDTLDFATDIRVADVYFLMDTTGSMGGAITSLRTGLSTPGSGLIDRVRAVIPDVWFGVGGYDDYQVDPYGYATSGDRA